MPDPSANIANPGGLAVPDKGQTTHNTASRKVPSGMSRHQYRIVHRLCDGCNKRIPDDSPYKRRCVSCQVRARQKLRERLGAKPYSQCGVGRRPLAEPEA